MSGSALGIQQCDECGKGMLKAHRIEAERRFCGTCYKRIFERKQCPQCGFFARLPKNDSDAVCRQCIKQTPCVRCGKRHYKIGKFTQYGPVCNACSVYFRSPKPDRGAAEVGLTKADVEKRIADRGTCQDCRRHRRLSMAATGRRLCATCMEIGLVPCPSCGINMPAGRGNACHDCYWKSTYLKRVQLDQAGLSTSAFVLIFRAFSTWLLGRVPPQKAALTIHGYFPFFYEMEQQWGKIPSYPQLLAHFNAEGLRRVRLPMRWLAETAQVVVDGTERENASELRRIAAILASVPAGTEASTILAEYNNELQAKMAAGQTSVRTVRLSLRPAASLLSSAANSGFELPNQTALDRYLMTVPGQKATIMGFVAFMNKRYGTSLVARLDKQRTKSRRQKQLEVELAGLLAQKVRADDFEKRWVSVALEYFHGLAYGLSGKLKDTMVSAQETGFQIDWQGNSYWIPHWDYHPNLLVSSRGEQKTEKE